jgi:hypothetical protein
MTRVFSLRLAAAIFCLAALLLSPLSVSAGTYSANDQLGLNEALDKPDTDITVNIRFVGHNPIREEYHDPVQFRRALHHHAGL